ncbi:MAG: FkbM family methyltransferase [Candidatus Omnitrophota bacterium]
MKYSSLVSAIQYYGYPFPNHFGKWWLHARLRKVFKITINEDMVVERGGLRWILNPSDYVQSELFWLGLRDRWNSYHVKNIIKPANTILDIGANFGYYSIICASSLKGNCRVYAFEPNSPSFNRLKKNIELNSLEGSVTAACV